MSYQRFGLDSSAPSLWRVTFNHPPINLIDSVLIAELSELFIDVERNNGPAVIVFDSADPDYFLAHYDISDDNRSRHLLPARSARSANQTGDPVSLVPVQPQIHRRSRHTRQRGNLFLLPPLSPPHHDSRPRRHGCRRVRAVRQRSQLFPVIRFQLHTIIKHEIRNYVKLIGSRDTSQIAECALQRLTHDRRYIQLQRIHAHEYVLHTLSAGEPHFLASLSRSRPPRVPQCAQTALEAASPSGS